VRGGGGELLLVDLRRELLELRDRRRVGRRGLGRRRLGRRRDGYLGGRRSGFLATNAAAGRKEREGGEQGQAEG
jgi:hypothetical protein